MVDLTSGLDVRELTIRYGAVTAVEDLAFAAPVGRITGLIGPNGAGKTTTFNACCGLLAPSRGQVVFDGREITRIGTAARARLGIGRTFQRLELFSSMTVAENVALGRDAPMGGRSPLRQFVASRKERAEVVAATEDALTLCGLQAVASRMAADLSTGQKRLLELARALAGNHRLLLLDEPSAGLDQSESEHFGAILQDLVRSRGLGILLVEHDMALVMRICEYLYVLDFGRLIFEGTPAEAQGSPVVRAAYLGSQDVDALAEGVAHARV